MPAPLIEIKKWSALQLSGAVLVLCSLVWFALFISSTWADFPRQGSIYDWWRASLLYKQAQALRIDYKTVDAVAKYGEAIKIYPQDARFQVGLARAYLDEDDSRKARESLDKAIKLNPESKDAWLLLSQVSLMANDKRTAYDSASRALVLSKKDPAVLAQMGLVWFETGQMEAAERIFSQSTGLGNGSPEFWFCAGKFHWRTGRLQRAIADLRQASAMNPRNAEYHEWLGLLLPRDSKSNEAEAELRRAVELNANSPVFMHNLADCLVARNKQDQAVQFFQRAAALRAGDADYWRDLGKLFMSRKQHNDAERAFGRALEIQPGDGPTNGLYVTALKLQRKYPEAEKAMLSYIKGGHEQSSLLWIYLAELYTEDGQSREKVVAAYNQALKNAPTDQLKQFIRDRLSGQKNGPVKESFALDSTAQSAETGEVKQ